MIYSISNNIQIENNLMSDIIKSCKMDATEQTQALLLELSELIIK